MAHRANDRARDDQQVPGCEWYGRNGTQYVCYIHSIGTSMGDVGGNYVYRRVTHVDESGTTIWTPI